MISLVSRGIKGMINGAGNLIARTLNKPIKPRWLFFATTEKCNSRCQHCNIWQNKSDNIPLSPGEISKILKSDTFRGVEYILNTGGEPTLRSDLKELFMSEHSALPKAGLQLSTNGLLPDRTIDLVKYLIEKGICIDIGTSLDGTGENHDFIRGVKGNFNKVDRLLGELVEIKKSNPDKLSISIGFTLSALSLAQLPDVRKYLCENYGIEPSVLWYNEASFYDNFGGKAAKKEDMIEIVQALEPQILGGLELKEMWLRWLRGKPIKFPCFAMNTFCVLKSNGDVVPCLTLWDVKAGNVRENTPEEVWNSKSANEARKIVKNCAGCLNTWGTNWSWSSYFFPYLLTYLQRPHLLAKIKR
jgi:MoaA/NifB/PqqE/SkfB family radical SAM enzyme